MYKKGVIHRDVSAYNGIITKTGGHIIDFDHSKISTRTTALPRAQTVLGLADRMRLSRDYDDESIQLAERVYGEEAAFLQRFENHDGMHTAQTLGWCTKDEPLYDRPVFTNRRPGKGYITGTPPFISPQLTPKVAHDGIHDGDSLWWVLFLILVSYTGPGTPRFRKISDPPGSNGPQDTSLAAGIKAAEDTRRDYFFLGDEAVLRDKKLELFQDKARLDQILKHVVSDYFSDLESLIVGWYNLLKCAWSWPCGYEYHYPHRKVRNLLQKTLEKIQASSEDEHKKYHAMIE
ncbi:hypothetical protein P691DRAFT_837585, partial [Macrolepiota fuliginosa MF-IS2]